jgi:SAM-dependent methyltransferase
LRGVHGWRKIAAMRDHRPAVAADTDAEGRAGDTMADYDVSTYGDRIADVYDRLPQIPDNAEAAVAALASLAGSGPVLELGIGTGRIALPLAARGLAVHGIDASEAMVKRLRTKPGGDRIPVAMGNFADVALEARFSLIYVAFNSFFGLLSQDDQVRCFARVAERLTEQGVFVIEAFVPDVTRFDRGQRLAVTTMGVDDLQLEASVHDPVEQRVRAQHIVISAEGTKLYPVQLRYAWPSELDLMARLAGLRLRDRWGGWDRRPFTAASTSHVSIYAAGIPAL